VEKGGIHLWVNKSASNFADISEMIVDNAAAQKANGLNVTADKNWVYVLPTDIL
jgi:hypothetical protein